MTQDNILTLTSCKYKDLPKYSTVINSNELEYFLWVYLNPEYVRDATFISAQELTDDVPVITFPNTFIRPSTSWIRMKTDNLNQKPGLHIYRFQFANPQTNDVFSLYANYVIQTSDVEKPYIYMKRDNDGEENC